MIKTFLICSLSGRIDDLMALIASLEKYKGWRLCLSLQMYSQTEIDLIKLHCQNVFPGRWSIYAQNRMTGPHLARCAVFERYQSDIWCILDDDMLAVDGITDYDAMAGMLWTNRSIGILSSNWRKTREMLDKVELKNQLVKQTIVYTGGGMMLRSDLVDILLKIPRTQYLFDNPLWSIYSYVNGYENYRYLGSAAVHKICTKGGRRKWIAETDSVKSLPPKDWLRTRRGKSKSEFDEYLICDSSDVTDEAKRLHFQNKR